MPHNLDPYMKTYYEMRNAGFKVVLIDNYKDYFNSVNRWRGTSNLGNPHFKFLMVGGPTGIGKSYNISLPPAVSKKVNASIPGLYRLLYENSLPTKLLVLDDMEPIFSNRVTNDLLKAATLKPANMNWDTEYKFGKLNPDGSQQVPKTFEYQGSLAVIANFFPSVAKYGPLYQRAKDGLILFMPNKDEIHKYAGTWFDVINHKDIYDFVGNNLDRYEPLNAYSYIDAVDWKLDDCDWRAKSQQFWASPAGNPKKIAAMAIFKDSKIKSMSAKCKAWMKLTELSQPSWYVYRRECKAKLGK